MRAKYLICTPDVIVRHCLAIGLLTSNAIQCSLFRRVRSKTGPCIYIVLLLCLALR